MARDAFCPLNGHHMHSCRSGPCLLKLTKPNLVEEFKCQILEVPDANTQPTIQMPILNLQNYLIQPTLAKKNLIKK
jgi:hypothetical protein